MVKEIPQEFRAAKNERFQSAPWIWMLEVQVPTTTPLVIRLCNHTKEVQFDSDDTGTEYTFQPAPFSFGEVMLNTAGDLPSLPLTLSNVTREVMAVLLNNDFLVGQKARVMLVNANTIDNPQARLDFQLEVRSVAVAESTITFSLSSYSLNSVVTPRRRMTRTVCDHDYGGALCGFDIPLHDPGLTILGPCAKTETACTLRGDREVANLATRQHPQRIGLFKGLPLAGNAG